MREFTISTLVRECQECELSALDCELVEAAKDATRTSYAPYSRFHVGAAIRMDNGEICRGSNQENAAYPSGLCAERTAAFHASASFPGMPMRKIAIAAWTEAGKPEGLPYEEYFQRLPISPCGGCRQALLEYETLHGNMEVILYGLDKIYILPSIASLLPFSFTSF